MNPPALEATIPTDFALRSRFLFTPEGTAEDAWLIVRAGRIDEIINAAMPPAQFSRLPNFDLGATAIIPGLVNTHTHLEFSHLKEPLGQPGMPLPDWIRLVIQERQAWADFHEHNEVAAVEHSLADGLRESLAAGVTHLGEIASPRWTAVPFRQSSMHVVAFRELIASDPELAVGQVDIAKEHCDQTATGNAKGIGHNASRLFPGVSPHAPYSTSLELVRQSVALATNRGLPVAMHLAESREEIELLATGGGPFRELLDDLDVWRADAIPPDTRPLDYLKVLAAAPRALVIHGNYLDDEELAFLAARRETMSLVFCPRTHVFFGHQPYPLQRALELGVDVAIGTDSRASNPDLNLFAELKHIARTFDIAREQVLRLGTRRELLANGPGARDSRSNDSPSTNAEATLTFVQLPKKNEASSPPWELLFDEASHVAASVIHGRPTTQAAADWLNARRK